VQDICYYQTMKEIEKFILPLTAEQFASALAKGQGRAFLHLRDFMRQEDIPALLDACLNNKVYDQQSEACRANWLWALMGQAGVRDRFRDPILKALLEDGSFDDILQLVRLAELFAMEGDDLARDAIYARQESHPDAGDWQADISILRLDRLAGLRRILAVRGRAVKDNPDCWVDEGVIELAADLLGADEVHGAVARWKEEDPDVRIYMESVTKWWEQDGDAHVYREGGAMNNILLKEPNPKRKEYPCEELLKEIYESEPTKKRGWFMSRGAECAGKHDLSHIWQLILTEKDKHILARMLWVFAKVKAQELNSRVLELAESEDEELCHAALLVIRHFQDAKVRELALRGLERGPKMNMSYYIDLLILNYEPGDARLIWRAVGRLEDGEDIHYAGVSLGKLAGYVGDCQLTELMVWIYERTSCSICRETALTILIDFQKAPDWVLDECEYDASDSVRGIAGEAPWPGPNPAN